MLLPCRGICRCCYPATLLATAAAAVAAIAAIACSEALKGIVISSRCSRCSSACSSSWDCAVLSTIAGAASSSGSVGVLGGGVAGGISDDGLGLLVPLEPCPGQAGTADLSLPGDITITARAGEAGMTWCT